MTPREFDPAVVHARLVKLDELLADLASAGDLTKELLEQDRMRRHAVERLLGQVVDVAVSINSHVAATVLRRGPKDYRESFLMAAEAGMLSQELAVRLQPSVGLRNVLAHEYLEIDLEIVARAAGTAVVDYREYVHAASGWLRSQ